MVLIICLFAMAMLIYLNQSSIIEPFYSTLNMTSGESPYKCGSCTKYGPTFDYKSQNYNIIKEKINGNVFSTYSI